MRLDERARQAAAGIHDAVSALHAPSLAAGRAGPAARKWAILAAATGTLIIILGAVAVGHLLSGTANRKAATPVTPQGVILFGQWHPTTQEANWFTVRPDGTGLRNLHVLATCATWWPDDSKILITDDARAHAGFPLRPATINPDGTGLHPLTAALNPTLNLGCGDVSPDTRTIVIEGFSDTRPAVDGIYTIRSSDGGHLVRLTHNPIGTTDNNPRFAPNGRDIVFMRTKPGTGTEGAGALFVTTIHGGTAKRITPWGSVFPGYDWSPNGQWIAFQRPYGQLYLIHPDGSGLHRIPLHLPNGAGAQNPAWAPDSKHIVFSLRTGAHANLCIVNIDGTGQQQITHSVRAENQTPDWTN